MNRITLFIISIMLGASSAYATDLRKNCPSNVAEALKSVDTNLQKGNWVFVPIVTCLHIQDEIRKNAAKYIEAGMTTKLIPLMDQKTLRIYRNTFYAIHGYIFKSQELNNYFAQFSWYKPKLAETRSITFSASDRKTLSLLSDIERHWRRPRPCSQCDTNVEFVQSPTPQHIRINKNKILFQNNSAINISPSVTPIKSIPGASDHTYYSANWIDSWDKLLLCKYTNSEGMGVDDLHITNLSLYSRVGKSKRRYETSSLADDDSFYQFASCPRRLGRYPNLIANYSDMGKGGVIDYVLLVFNQSLKPVTKTHGKIYLFEPTNGHGIYYVTLNDKFTMDNSQSSQERDAYTLWRLNGNGTSSKLSDKTNEYNYAKRYFTAFGKNQFVDIYGQLYKFDEAIIDTAIELDGNLVLFSEDFGYKANGITLIPLQKTN